MQLSSCTEYGVAQSSVRFVYADDCAYLYVCLHLYLCECVCVCVLNGLVSACIWMDNRPQLFAVFLSDAVVAPANSALTSSFPFPIIRAVRSECVLNYGICFHRITALMVRGTNVWCRDCDIKLYIFIHLDYVGSIWFSIKLEMTMSNILVAFIKFYLFNICLIMIFRIGRVHIKKEVVGRASACTSFFRSFTINYFSN